MKTRNIEIKMVPSSNEGEDYWYGILWAQPFGDEPKNVKCAAGGCTRKWSGENWAILICDTYKNGKLYHRDVDQFCVKHIGEWLDNRGIAKECEDDTAHMRSGPQRSAAQSSCFIRKSEEAETGHYDEGDESQNG